MCLDMAVNSLTFVSRLEILSKDSRQRLFVAPSQRPPTQETPFRLNHHKLVERQTLHESSFGEVGHRHAPAAIERQSRLGGDATKARARHEFGTHKLRCPDEANLREACLGAEPCAREVALLQKLRLGEIGAVYEPRILERGIRRKNDRRKT